ncbi:MAG: HAMP domain-containing histidine kinase [Chitinophagales bacterium]|nr:HAMP domain-containing histidine kinase [Chitinophagales bacterium]
MQKRFLILASVLILVGLIGLTGIQLLWLKNTIQAKEQAFDIAVFEALDQISGQIKYQGYQPLIDELFESTFPSDSTEESKNYVILPDSTSIDSTTNAEYVDSTGLKSADNLMGIGESNAESTFKFKKDHNEFDPEMGRPVEDDVKELMEQMQKEQEDFISKMYEQLVNVQPITELIDTSRLLETIAASLKDRGINTGFQYAISELSENNFVLISENASLRDLFLSPYKKDLLQRTFFDTKKRLVLFFPDKKKFLLNEMLWQISSSAFFLIMVVIAFFLAIHIIFRQKYLSDMKTDFINNMTHELKTPIATISLASEMLRDKMIGASEENRARYAGIIFEENKRLGNHVEKVLQIARLEKGEIQLNKTPVDVHQLITGLLNNFQLQVEENEGELLTDFQCKEPWINVDEMHFSNVISNLLDNAVKYNDKKPVIKVSTSDEKDGILFEISDNGIGLSKDDQKRVFEKFYRVQKGNLHDTKGFGLGLSYVKTIVDKHGGSIFVVSKPKEGSIFKIYIPKTK